MYRLTHEREVMHQLMLITFLFLCRIEGRAAGLNADPSSPLYKSLIMDGLHDVFTVLESDLGTPLADIYYLSEAVSRKTEHRVVVVGTNG